MEETFDLAVIGSGTGGYPAAIKAAQKGLKVALIESGEVGGTCLNRGCIPSKALISGAEVLQQIKEAEHFGIHVENTTVDYAKLTQHKDQVVNKMRTGLQGLIQANGITLIKGKGRLTGPKEIKVLGEQNHLIRADKIIIATGSEPRSMPAFPCDYERIHDSTSLLQMTKLPKSLAIIGGGVIGCEFASLFNILGVEVTILELMPSIIPTECAIIREALAKTLAKRGISIKTGVKVEKVERNEKGVQIVLEGGEQVDAEMVLVSVGRSMNSSDIGLEKAGIAAEPQGTIKVNERMETNVPGIYAVGDLVGRWWLAHVATHQGVVAAINATGGNAVMHYNAIPAVIYTHPEAASVGMSEEAAKDQGIETVIGNFPFQALGKAQAAGHPEGFVQIVADKKNGEILGAQVFGHEASTLIAQMTMAIANELTLESVAETIHAHPTMSEAWHEAANIALGAPLHWPPSKRKKG